MTLRAACIHGRYERHPHPDGYRCPGGREVTIDYEAGAALHFDAQGWGFTGPFDDWLIENVRQVVDAALGIGDTDEEASK